MNTLSIESLQHHLLTEAFPTLAKSIEKETKLQSFTMNNLLEMYGLKTVCIRTVHKWMRRLGFKYETRKKDTM